MHNKLSPPLTLMQDFQSSIDKAFDYFKEHIFNRDVRPLLFDKNVFIEANEMVEGRPVGFWHLVSLECGHKFAKVLPCCNDDSISLCAENCNTEKHQVSVQHGAEDRNLCLLRASRLPWIIDIINLANKNDPDVQVWLKPGGNKKSDKLYLRYAQGGADYVLIFTIEKHFYRLISAFPVFYLHNKAELNTEFVNYKWSYFK